VQFFTKGLIDPLQPWLAVEIIKGHPIRQGKGVRVVVLIIHE